MLLGIYHAALGKPAEEVKHMQEAVAIDPLSFYMARQYGTALLFAGRYDEALRELDYARGIRRQQIWSTIGSAKSTRREEWLMKRSGTTSRN